MKLFKSIILPLFITLFIMCSYSSSEAMLNPSGEGIAWGDQDARVFITSVTINVFGRYPTQKDTDIFNQYRSSSLKLQRLQFFLSIIGSTEYKNLFDYLERSQHIWFNPLKSPEYSGLCGCYYFAEFSNGGLMPDIQYIGVQPPFGPHNASVARALVEMSWAFDRNSCPDYNCGRASEATWIPPVSPNSDSYPSPYPDSDSYPSPYPDSDSYPSPYPDSDSAPTPPSQCSGHTLFCKSRPNLLWQVFKTNGVSLDNKQPYGVCDICGLPNTFSTGNRECRTSPWKPRQD